MKNVTTNILISIYIALLIIPFVSAVNPDIVTYYRGLGQDINIVETNDFMR